MTQQRPNQAIRTILEDLSQGRTTPDQALSLLQLQPYQELMAGLSLDTHRETRTGQGEVVFAPGKSPDQLIGAVSGLGAAGRPVLVTKLNPEQGTLLQEHFPHGQFRPEAGIFFCNTTIALDEPWPRTGEACIVSAGAADLPVALEALATGLFYDLDIGLITDVGVAGLHRLSPHLENLQKARLLIVVAGMEGALPSVLAGLLGKPIIAVPTSVGYGAAFQGMTALFGMLSSCAPGIAVVNIDNGFGAAVMAKKILDMP
ncbi:MAG: nickel pincer cofactor biosynthesis protein LarB [Desulfohalobiaceae bacterium]|nr:nickel pincer cofactor biosynthesis protein LarB [Desulfohalobiaceae bacterium]